MLWGLISSDKSNKQVFYGNKWRKKNRDWYQVLNTSIICLLDHDTRVIQGMTALKGKRDAQDFTVKTENQAVKGKQVC